MSEFKEFEINDWVKANDGQFGFNELFKIVDFFADRNGTLLAVLDDGDCYPLSCLEHASEDEIKAGHPLNDIKMEVSYGIKLNDLGVVTMGFDLGKDITHDLGDDSHIENHISPYCKSKDV